MQPCTGLHVLSVSILTLRLWASMHPAIQHLSSAYIRRTGITRHGPLLRQYVSVPQHGAQQDAPFPVAKLA